MKKLSMLVYNYNLSILGDRDRKIAGVSPSGQFSYLVRTCLKMKKIKIKIKNEGKGQECSSLQRSCIQSPPTHTHTHTLGCVCWVSLLIAFSYLASWLPSSLIPVLLTWPLSTEIPSTSAASAQPACKKALSSNDAPTYILLISSEFYLNIRISHLFNHTIF